MYFISVGLVVHQGLPLSHRRISMSGHLMNFVVCASVYMAHDTDIPSAKLKSLVRYCETANLPMVLGCDANAHHTLWGSTDINGRGELLLEFLLGTTLEVVNRGHKPTFVTKARKEVLDITLMSDELIHLLDRWEVLDDESFYRFVSFAIRLGPPEPIFYRNIRKTNWVEFVEYVEKDMIGLTIPQMDSIEDIEAGADQVNKEG